MSTTSAKVSVAGVLLLCSGCLSYLFTGAGTVKDEFVEAQTCPAARVKVDRVDPPAWLKPPDPPPPPPEIAADPERAALWAEQHPPESWAGRRVFRVTGCGHSDFYMCDVWQENDDGSQSPTCVPAPDLGEVSVSLP